MQVIRSLPELDAKLAECDAAERVSDDAMRAVFGTFRMDTPRDLPADPMSEAYRLAQLALYRGIAGRPYAPANEVTPFDVATALRHPFPYATRSATTTGEQLMAIGFLIRAMGLAPGARVLEFGPGWGNTTLALAQLGYEVTAVDIERRFCDLISRRAGQVGVPVQVVQDEFFWAERCSEQFDAVLFYECFHHCDDHLRLLRALQRCVAPGGRLVFAAEPITDDFPLPWGLRLDGNSLWAIRKNGWLELGFSDTYFIRALAECGWRGTRIACADPGWMSVWLADRRAAPVFVADGGDGRIASAIGRRAGNRLMVDTGVEGTALYGPYVTVPAGQFVARVTFGTELAPSGQAEMNIACDAGERVLVRRPVDAAAIGPGGVAELEFDLEAPAEKVEVRLFAEPGFRAAIAGVAILTR